MPFNHRSFIRNIETNRRESVPRPKLDSEIATAVFKHNEPVPSGSPVYFHSLVIHCDFVQIGVRLSMKFIC